MRELQLHGKTAAEYGFLGVVDDDDYERVNQCRWRAVINGRRKQPYIRRWVGRADGGYFEWLHWFITGSRWIDHIDGNGLNNRKVNLRPANAFLNAGNRRPDREHRFKGITRRSGGWEASLHTNGKRAYLGVFSTEEDAARAYDRAAFAKWGEYAWLNFPDDMDLPSPQKRLSVGADHCHAVLTDEQVRMIRREYSGRRGSQAELARRLGVTPQVINDVLRGRTYASVDGEG